MDIYKRLRSRRVLHQAWAKVKSSGLSSESDTTKKHTLLFGERWLSNLEKIQQQLQRQTFSFSGEWGVTPQKGKGKSGVRPIVVAPIANRVVRRAILDVLQGYGGEEGRQPKWQGIRAIREVMDTPTSVGGIPKKGVPEGLAIIRSAIRSGKHSFIRSDIRDFFTRIPKPTVNQFVRDAVKDDRFATLFERALETNLENQAELEERDHFKLFPNPEIGVAQGSALSALAGNIALREFDTLLNARGVVCVRYIDDFILLAESETKVQKAFKSAQKLLSTLGMDVYDPFDANARSSGKVDSGNVHKGTDILGYRLSGEALQPSRAAIRKFLSKLDVLVESAVKEMNLAAQGKAKSHEFRLSQTLVQMHQIIWGWSQSFRHTTVRHVFVTLDSEINRRISALETEAQKIVGSSGEAMRRRVLGVHLLADTKDYPLSLSVD